MVMMPLTRHIHDALSRRAPCERQATPLDRLAQMKRGYGASSLACKYACAYAKCMNEAHWRLRIKKAASICASSGITQVEIARALGASQSQVSRILNGQSKRPSRLVEEVCLHLERSAGHGVTAEAVKGNSQLVEAMRFVWDGSSAQAEALSTVIRSLAGLRMPVRPPTSSLKRSR